MTYLTNYFTDALPADDIDRAVVRMTRKKLGPRTICMILDLTPDELDQRVRDLEKTYDL